MTIKKDIIYIDSREHSRIDAFLNFLEEHKITSNPLTEPNTIKTTGKKENLNINGYHIGNLPIGDFGLNGTYFEFKTADDLKNSINGKDKRLDNQIDNFRTAYYDKQFLVITDGKYELGFNETNYFSNEIDVPFIQLDNLEDCFKYMVNTWTYLNNNYNCFLNKTYEGNGFKQFGRGLVTSLTLNKISKEYPYHKASDWNKISKEDLTNISGIGEKTAEQIIRRKDALL